MKFVWHHAIAKGGGERPLLSQKRCMLSPSIHWKYREHYFYQRFDSGERITVSKGKDLGDVEALKEIRSTKVE